MRSNFYLLSFFKKIALALFFERSINLQSTAPKCALIFFSFCRSKLRSNSGELFICYLSFFRAPHQMKKAFMSEEPTLILNSSLRIYEESGEASALKGFDLASTWIAKKAKSSLATWKKSVWKWRLTLSIRSVEWSINLDMIAYCTSLYCK